MPKCDFNKVAKQLYMYYIYGFLFDLLTATLIYFFKFFRPEALLKRDSSTGVFL